MKALLLANSFVGLETLKYLLRNYRNDLVAVVALEKDEIYKEAETFGLEVLTYNELLKKVDDNELIDFDYGILAWWPKIIKEKLIQKPKRGFINFHPSMLPYNRGKNYNFWALVEGAPFGVTIHFVEKEIDSGDILAQREIKYDWTDTGESLYNKAREEMLNLFAEFYPKLRVDNYIRKKQDLSLGSFHLASELNLASKIDLEKSYKARDLINLMRARTFKGYPGCYFFENNKKYEISIEIRQV